jgi:hypothetical protein
VASDPVDQVRATLESYAARGVFKSFSQVSRQGSRAEFRFLWFRDVVFTVRFDARRRTLTFSDLLPNAPRGSDIDRELRQFIRGKSSKAIPGHRRIDPQRLDVTCVNRAGRVSVFFRIRTKNLDYAVRKSVHLIHDVLMDFLNDGRFTSHLVTHFNLDPELA